MWESEQCQWAGGVGVLGGQHGGLPAAPPEPPVQLTEFTPHVTLTETGLGAESYFHRQVTQLAKSPSLPLSSSVK